MPRRNPPRNPPVTAPLAEDPGRDDDPRSRAPLFAGFDTEDAEIDHIVVYRTKPLQEGQLDRLDVSATEEDIRERWGGGTFRVVGRDSNNKMLSGAYKTVDLAGDPIFDSDVSRRKWDAMRRRMGGLAAEPTTPAPPAAPAGGMSPTDLLMMMSKVSADARAEAREAAQQRESEARAGHDRNLEVMRQEAKQREKDAEARADRERENAKDQRERDRQFFAQLTDLMRDKGEKQDPMKALLAGVQLAQSLGSANSNQNPALAFVENLPDIVDAATELVAEARGKRGKKTEDGEDEGDDENAEPEFRATGQTAVTLKKVAEYFQAQGIDPAVAIERVAGVILRGKVDKPAATPAGPITTKPNGEKPAPATAGAAKPAGATVAG